MKKEKERRPPTHNKTMQMDPEEMKKFILKKRIIEEHNILNYIDATSVSEKKTVETQDKRTINYRNYTIEIYAKNPFSSHISLLNKQESKYPNTRN